MIKYKSINILGVKVADVTLENIVSVIEELISSPKKKSFFYANPQTINLYKENPEFKKSIDKATFIYPDGIGTIIASKILGKKLKARTTLLDFIHQLLAVVEARGWSIYILGGLPKVAKSVKENLIKNFPKLTVNFRNGYFSEDEIPDIIRDINAKKPKILLVGLGVPRQEIWINKYMSKIHAQAFFAVGGSLDVIAGSIPRAPKLVHESGFEWLYRMYREPSRLWKRYLFGNTIFMYHIFAEIMQK